MSFLRRWGQLILAICFGLFIFLGGLYFSGFWDYLNPSNEKPPGEPAPEFAPVPLAGPSVSITILDKNRILVTWENLPEGTSYLDIFRKKLADKRFVKWKTITLNENQTSGSAEIIVEDEDASEYEYYVQAGNQSGETLWTSYGISANPSGTPPPAQGTNPPQSPPGTPPPSPSGTPPGATPPPTPPGESPTPPPTPPTSSTSSPPAAPPPASPSGATTTSTPQDVYYNPQLQVSGYGNDLRQGSFWVFHVNKNIEIGWKDLPLSTDLVTIERSPSADGPWGALLTQTSPNVDSYSLRLVDDTLHSSHYYRLRAMNGATVLATYGPTLLEPLSQ